MASDLPITAYPFAAAAFPALGTMAKLTYKDAGRRPRCLRPDDGASASPVEEDLLPRVLPLEGGFAGLFQLDFSGPLFARNYEDPVLVACTDGVGTKIKIAIAADKYDTVGIDLVAMCVNDAICTGAEPLFFLDYIAMDRDDPERLEAVVRGVSQGCVESDCALLGGETAIMPDLTLPANSTWPVFCVAVADRKRIIDGKAIADGDVVLGVASSGLHSNGFSLVRKLVDAAGLGFDDHVEPLGKSVADVLLEPTRLYPSPLRRVLRHYRKKQVVHGIAHITGGGLLENVSRIVPSGVTAKIDRHNWPIPPVYDWLKSLVEVDDDEFDRVFNMGVGLVLIVAPFFAESIVSQLQPPVWTAFQSRWWKPATAKRGRSGVSCRKDQRGKLLSDAAAGNFCWARVPLERLMTSVGSRNLRIVPSLQLRAYAPGRA